MENAHSDSAEGMKILNSDFDFDLSIIKIPSILEPE